jgi:hypothetical protein
MGWKFWQKNDASQDAGELPKPKDLPESVGRYLVVDLKMDPDYVWTLKAALRPRQENRDVRDFRIFSPSRADAAGVTIRNYNTLEAHPDLILHEGWMNKKTNQVKFITKSTEKAA